MIEVLAKGIGVGFAIAAPVGPIGLLCIRRTWADGRAIGLATGLGAATADGVYGFMVAGGLAVTGLLVEHARPLSFVGGLLIVWLGVQAIRAYFARGEMKPAAAGEMRGVASAFATTFLLTLSNPMTILSFVALVTGLGPSLAASASAPFVLVAGVFTGSALWWVILVHLASFARARTTPEALRWIDLASGGLLIAWGAAIVGGAVLG